jgi:PAS domain S-box-containing protein
MTRKRNEGAPTPGREKSLAPESDLELREFIDHAPVGLRFLSREGRILWANQAELDLVGCSEQEYVGRHIGEFLVEPGAAAELLGRLVSGERIEAYRARLRSKDGSTRRVIIDASALYRDGQFVHGRTVTRDITAFLQEEQAARHRVEETSRLKDEFLALLSHELRSPLGTILVWLGLLQQGGLDVAESERALGIIERSARSLERIIEDLLHASRIAAGGLMLIPQLVDLRSVVQVAVDAASGDAGLKGLELTSSHGEIPIWVTGDPHRLQQAVSNLLSNAIKFTPAGGKVEVCLDTEDRRARLRVTDTGEGMSPEFLPFAFKRFRQQDTTSTRAHHGLGLGLYVVGHVIEHHGGRVNAESPGPGRGSTITAFVPLATERFTDATASVSGTRISSGAGLPVGLKVLLVDDEEDTREAMRRILQQNGMLVTTAASAREGFELLEHLQPDIILSDIAMPGEDGLSLIRRVRLLPLDRGGQIPAAALSAYAGVEDRQRALLAGFQYYIPKPVDPDHLLAVIAKMARKSAGRNEKR